jgi:hypothetical protein
MKRLIFLFSTTSACVIGVFLITVLMGLVKLVLGEGFAVSGLIFSFFLVAGISIFVLGLPVDFWRIIRIKRTCQLNGLSMTEFIKMKTDEQNRLLRGEKQ